jgi:hypothetical protein
MQENKYNLSTEALINLYCNVRGLKRILTVIVKATMPRLKPDWWNIIFQNYIPQLLGFDPRSRHVGFLEEKVASGWVFFKHFSVPCQFSFHQVLHAT